MCLSTSNSDYPYGFGTKKKSDWLSRTVNDLTVFEKILYKTQCSSLVQFQTYLNGEGLLRAKKKKKKKTGKET